MAQVLNGMAGRGSCDIASHVATGTSKGAHTNFGQNWSVQLPQMPQQQVTDDSTAAPPWQ